MIVLKKSIARNTLFLINKMIMHRVMLNILKIKIFKSFHQKTSKIIRIEIV